MLWIILTTGCETKEIQESEPCVQETWFQDQDGDGFGDPFVSTLSCVQEDGFVDNDQDCDDENAMAYPDAPASSHRLSLVSKTAFGLISMP